MAAEHRTRAAVAADFEDGAANILQRFTEEGGVNAGDLAVAQVMATLSLGQRLADLTDKLGDYLGDDSHLDRLSREVRDGLDAIRVDGVGVG